MNRKWSLAPLGIIIKYRKDFIQIDDTQTYKRCRVQCHAQGIVLRDIVQGAEIKTKKQQLCRKGEFLVAEIDAKVGGFGIVPEKLDGAIVSSHYFLFQINEQLIDRSFFYFCIQTPTFRDQVTAQGSTNYAAIRPQEVLTYQIPLPPLDEQQRIVVRIEELVGKVEEARGLRSQANQQLKAFVSSVHLHLAESRTVKLSEILELDERSEIVQIGQQYPQVGVKGFGGGLFAKEVVEATQTTYKAFNRLYEGAIVLSQVKGWEGAIAGCTASLVGRYVSPEYRTFCCIEGQAIPGYISALVITPWFWNQLKNFSRGLGGRRERIHPEQFLQMEVPMPNIDLQKQALESFSKLSVLEQLQTETAAELDALLPSILDKAFKGEL